MSIMNGRAYTSLEKVIYDRNFPKVDTALRHGRHIDRDDGPWFYFLEQAQPLLEPFYQHFDYELIRADAGYYYLLPLGRRVRRHLLTKAEMLVGQALALLYLDPTLLGSGGMVTWEHLLTHLNGLVGRDRLVRLLNGHRSPRDERVAEEKARQGIMKALNGLEKLGFIRKVSNEAFGLRVALMRFTEPVQGLSPLEEAMTRLIREGRAEMPLQDGEALDDDPSDPNDDDPA